MKISAGTLLYRKTRVDRQVLIVHPSGRYNAKAPWSIPKGLPEVGEDLESAARRETHEETGVIPNALIPLGHVDLPSKKRIFCYAGPAPEDIHPVCASWEVDRAEFMSIPIARKLLHPNLVELLDRLEVLLSADDHYCDDFAPGDTE